MLFQKHHNRLDLGKMALMTWAAAAILILFAVCITTDSGVPGRRRLPAKAVWKCKKCHAETEIKNGLAAKCGSCQRKFPTLLGRFLIIKGKWKDATQNLLTAYNRMSALAKDKLHQAKEINALTKKIQVMTKELEAMRKQLEVMMKELEKQNQLKLTQHILEFIDNMSPEQHCISSTVAGHVGSYTGNRTTTKPPPLFKPAAPKVKRKPKGQTPTFACKWYSLGCLELTKGKSNMLAHAQKCQYRPKNYRKGK